MAGSGDDVFGHFMQQGSSWQPLLGDSSALFGAVVSDALGPVEAYVESGSGAKLDAFHLVLYWGGSDPSPAADQAQQPGEAAAPKQSARCSVRQRTLLQIAAGAASLRVLSYLLSKGAEPSKRSPDGLTSYDFALSSEAPTSATMLAMLKDADHMPQKGASGNFSSELGGQDLGEGDPFNSSSPMYSTADLTRPEYSTDTFRMFCFKVLRCSKRHAHDWRACPFAHPTENARRRDPREFKYCAVACPEYKQGFCIRGDLCPYSHGVFECWLHPSRYRTQLCKDGVNCTRPVCFFAHSLPELRTPTHTWVPTAEEVGRIGPAQPLQPGQPFSGGPSGIPSAVGMPMPGSLMAAAAAAAAANGDSGPGSSSNSGPLRSLAAAQALAAAGMGGISAMMAQASNGGRGSTAVNEGDAIQHSRSSGMAGMGMGQHVNGVSSPRIIRHLSDPLSSSSDGNGPTNASHQHHYNGHNSHGDNGSNGAGSGSGTSSAGEGSGPGGSVGTLQHSHHSHGMSSGTVGSSACNGNRSGDSCSNNSSSSSCNGGDNSGSSGQVSHTNSGSGLQSPISGTTSPLAHASGTMMSHSSSCMGNGANACGNGSTMACNGTGSSGSYGSGGQMHASAHGCTPAQRDAVVAAAAAQAQVDVKAAAAQMVAAAAAGGAGHGAKPSNLTQVSATSSLLGFTAPRMSNAFARRHGLNPKDNPMLNLQKIALQSHDTPGQGQGGNNNGNGSAGRRSNNNGPTGNGGGQGGQYGMPPSSGAPPMQQQHAVVHSAVQRQVRHQLPSSNYGGGLYSSGAAGNGSMGGMGGMGGVMHSSISPAMAAAYGGGGLQHTGSSGLQHSSSGGLQHSGSGGLQHSGSGGLGGMGGMAHAGADVHSSNLLAAQLAQLNLQHHQHPQAAAMGMAGMVQHMGGHMGARIPNMGGMQGLQGAGATSSAMLAQGLQGLSHMAVSPMAGLAHGMAGYGNGAMLHAAAAAAAAAAAGGGYGGHLAGQHHHPQAYDPQAEV